MSDLNIGLLILIAMDNDRSVLMQITMYKDKKPADLDGGENQI